MSEANVGIGANFDMEDIALILLPNVSSGNAVDSDFCGIVWIRF